MSRPANVCQGSTSKGSPDMAKPAESRGSTNSEASRGNGSNRMIERGMHGHTFKWHILLLGEQGGTKI